MLKTLRRQTFTDCLIPVLLGALFLASASAQAQETPKAWHLRTLIMETEPWGFYAPSGEMRGIWPDIVHELEQATRLDLHKQLAPYARVLQSLAVGDADISFLYRSSQRETEVFHAGVLFDMGSVVQARKGIQLKTYADLQNLRIGVIQNILLAPHFDEDDQLHKIFARNYETLLTMLAAGRLDAVAGNSLSLAYLHKKNQLQEYFGDRLVLTAKPVTLQFSRNSPHVDLVPWIRQVVGELRRSGRIDAVLDAWAGRSWRLDLKESL